MAAMVGITGNVAAVDPDPHAKEHLPENLD
jgi:hypothetical protein